MSIPINQATKIVKYFHLLVQEFIKDPKHKDIEITFQDFLESETQGQTTQKTKIKKNTTKNGQVLQELIYKYEIIFLASGYKDEDELRAAVVHEFTHLYLYATI